MRVILFGKQAGNPEVRIAEFVETGPPPVKYWVTVRMMAGLTHEPCSPNFDAVRLDLKQLAALGVDELRLEVQS